MNYILLSALLASTAVGMDSASMASPSRKRSHDQMMEFPVLESAKGHLRHQALTKWKNAIARSDDPDVRAVMFDETGRMQSVATYDEAEYFNREIQQRRAVRQHAPDRSNIHKRAKFVEDELVLGIHQCYGIAEDELDSLTTVQTRLDNIIAHSKSITQDTKTSVLTGYIQYKRPQQHPDDEINTSVAQILSGFISTLRETQSLLNAIPDDTLAIAPKTALAGTRETAVPALLERINVYFQEHGHPSEATYPTIKSLLLALKIYDVDIAHHRSGQSGVKGLTRLESLIGGYEFGSEATFYPQNPSLYNVILSCNLDPQLKEKLIHCRARLLEISRLITESPSAQLTNPGVIALLCNHNRKIHLDAQLLADQHQQQTLSYSAVMSNINLWSQQKSFLELHALKTKDDFGTYNTEAKARSSRFNTIHRTLTQMAETFSGRIQSLAPVTKMLKMLGVTPSLDMTRASDFTETIEDFFESKPGQITVGMLEHDIGQYFQAERRSTFLSDLVWYKNEQRSIQDSAQINALIASIIEAQNAHVAFMLSLQAIRDNFSNLKFKPTSDLGVQKSQLFLFDMLQPTNHYMTRPPRERADLYRHTLNALLDSTIWSDNSRDLALDLITTARDAYTQALSSIISITLPTYDDGESFIIPGFGTDDLDYVSEPTTGSAPPPPPPSFYTWQRLQTSLSHHIATQPEAKQTMIDILTEVINNALRYADATVPTASELKQKLGLNS